MVAAALGVPDAATTAGTAEGKSEEQQREDIELRNVLRAFSSNVDSIRYCQGMNYLARALLAVTGSEEAAYDIMVRSAWCLKS